MTTIAANILKSAVNGFKNHIVKRANNNNYAAKALLISSVGLNLYSNVVDYYKLENSKEIEKEEKKYLQSFRIANTLLSTAAQIAVGLAIISNKVQDRIIRGISYFYKDFEKKLTGPARSNLLKLTSLIGAIAITKRILVPLTATPLASWFNKKMNGDKHEKFSRPAGLKENIFEKFGPGFSGNENSGKLNLKSGFKTEKENIFKKFERKNA